MWSTVKCNRVYDELQEHKGSDKQPGGWQSSPILPKRYQQTEEKEGHRNSVKKTKRVLQSSSSLHGARIWWVEFKSGDEKRWSQKQTGTCSVAGGKPMQRMCGHVPSGTLQLWRGTCTTSFKEIGANSVSIMWEGTGLTSWSQEVS